MYLRVVANPVGAEAEGLHRPGQIGRAVAATQGQPFAQRRLVDLDDGDASYNFV